MRKNYKNKEKNRDLESISSAKYRQMQLSDLRQAINSPQGELVMWVLVEGRVDLELYARFFRPEVKVYMAGMRKEEGSKISGGSKAVRSIVNAVLMDGVTQRIIGIIDRDYTDYCFRPYKNKRSIFRTDCRDLEMTLMMMPSAWNYVTTLSSYVNVNAAQWEEVVRYLGTIRVYWAYYSIQGKFEIGVGKLYDNQCHRISPNWMSNALKIANACSGGGITNNLLSTIGRQFYLSSTPTAKFARGHDAFPLLINMMVNANMTEESLVMNMIRRCSLNDCRQLHLYRDIERWQHNMCLDIMI